MMRDYKDESRITNRDSSGQKPLTEVFASPFVGQLFFDLSLPVRRFLLQKFRLMTYLISHSRCGIAFRLICFLCTVVASSCPDLFAQDQPNIILINLDDADAELFELGNSDRLFPNIMGMGRDGLKFNNFHVTTPLCGPSRACLYRGQYAHNTGFYVNQSSLRESHNFDGGFKFYREKGYFENDLSTWMKDAGYRTMIVGKYLHHDFEPYVPPGWDDYYIYRGARYYGSYKFTNRDSVHGLGTQDPEDLYRTTSETQTAIELISRHVARDNGKPFFLNVNPLGPHRAQPNHPEMVDRRMESWWTQIRPPQSAAYDEPDNTDKRGFFAGQLRLNDRLHAEARKHYRERVLATRSVDDMVGDILESLKSLGLEDNTYVFVTSDNGFLLGHHRVFGKGVPANRTTRVPLFIKGPGVPQGQAANQLVGHIDLAPTFVELAGSDVPQWVDGFSFAELLTEDGLRSTRVFRNALLIENWFDISNMGRTKPAASNTLRLPNAMYTEWADGDRDFFDLTSDPQQLTNRFDDLSFTDKIILESLLRSLKNPARKPKARFSLPFVSGEEIAHGGELFGLAEDPVGVRRVRLLIQHDQTKGYWNGALWQAEPVLVDANLDAPDHQLTFWRYPLSSSMSVDEQGTYSVWTWAYDQELNYDNPSYSSFRFDNEGPTLELHQPDPGATITGVTLISGLASDNVEVATVKLLIRNLATNEYWNGEEFQSRRVFLAVEPNWRGAWKYRSRLPSGNYGLRVSAEDTSGNVSEGVLGRRFTVE